MTTTTGSADRRDAARRRRWASALSLRGMGVNAQLTGLLARQNAKLLDLKLPHERKPGMTPLERLRAFLDQISDAQRRLAAGPDATPAFGDCLRCGASLPLAVLDEAPWAELCARCEAQEAGIAPA